MAKRETDSTPKLTTRRQAAMTRRERERLKAFQTAIAIIVGLLVLVLSFGLIQSYYIEPNSTLAVVNGSEIVVQEYRDRVRYERYLLDEQYAQIVQQAQNLTEEDAQLQQIYAQVANQVAQQRSQVDRQTFDQMIEEELVKQEAEERGVTVSTEEVNEYINRFLAQRAGGVTTAAANETTTARAEASATAAMWTPTPTALPSPTMEGSEAVTETTPADTPVPPPPPTPNIITGDALSNQYATWINTLAEGAGVDEATYREFARTFVLENKMAELVGSEAPATAEQARARHILIRPEVGDPEDPEAEVSEEEEEAANTAAQATAEALTIQLQEGASFAELAAEYSDDPGSGAQGGDLGFVTRGTFVEPVDEAVFNRPLNDIGEPVVSDFGWHIIEVLERGERPLSPQDYQQAQQQAFNEWLTTARAEATIEEYWTAESAP